jgi:hypothetical protein
MTKKEIDFLTARISRVAKETLERESEKAGLSMTAYLEMLIEGTLTGRLEAKIEALRLEIEALRKQLKK